MSTRIVPFLLLISLPAFASSWKFFEPEVSPPPSAQADAPAHSFWEPPLQPFVSRPFGYHGPARPAGLRADQYLAIGHGRPKVIDLGGREWLDQTEFLPTFVLKDGTRKTMVFEYGTGEGLKVGLRVNGGAEQRRIMELLLKIWSSMPAEFTYVTSDPPDFVLRLLPAHEDEAYLIVNFAKGEPRDLLRRAFRSLAHHDLIFVTPEQLRTCRSTVAP